MNDDKAPAVFLIDDTGSLISCTAGAAASWCRLEATARELLDEVRDSNRTCAAECGEHVLHLAPLDRALFALIAFTREDDPIARLAERCRITPRECAVLRELAAGKTTAEISNHLSIAPSTVAMHIKRILAKTETPTRAAILGRVLDEAMRTTASPV